MKNNAISYANLIILSYDHRVLLQDPREALIVTLRREVEALQNENDHLRTALDINKKSASISSKSRNTNKTKKIVGKQSF